jgi:DNA-binding transcriptional LysR family regulator
VELRHLKYFVAVAELENVSRAALKLHVSQPALSRQIRDLEDELGFTLLERTAKSVRLTEAGRVFLAEARAVLARAEQAVKTARGVATGTRDELHVGYAPTLTARILPPALRTFQSAMPNVRVKLHDLSTEEMLNELRREKLHLALSARPAAGALRGLRFEELTREPLRLAVAPSHRLARRRVVSLAEAARELFIGYSRAEYPDYYVTLGEVFSSFPHEPRVIEEHDGVSSLISAIEAGAGVALVPDSTRCISALRLKLLPLAPEPEPLVVGVVLSRASAAPAVETFTASLRQNAAATPAMAAAARPALIGS